EPSIVPDPFSELPRQMAFRRGSSPPGSTEAPDSSIGSSPSQGRENPRTFQVLPIACGGSSDGRGPTYASGVLCGTPTLRATATKQPLGSLRPYLRSAGGWGKGPSRDNVSSRDECRPTSCHRPGSHAAS